MEFTVGQIIVHPHHGPATVRTISTRTVRGRSVEYLDLHVEDGDLDIRLPSDRAADLGLRPLRSVAELDRLLEIAAADGGETEAQWSRRMKDYRDKVSSDDFTSAIAVVRDLARRGFRKSLSLAERELLREAGTPIVRECALVWGIPVLAAQERLSHAIFGRDVNWSVDVDPAHTLG